MSEHRTPRRVWRMLRWLGAALTGAVVLACALLLVVRHVALPHLEGRRAEIASVLSRELGQPVEIDAITTAWDGWNPEVTVRGMRIGDRTGARVQPVLELPEVTGIVSWTSLPLMRLQFKELVIDRPRLAIRRDAQGRVHVAGIEIDPQAQDDDTAFVDWLLHQRRILVRDALIAWNDDLRNAPQLVLDGVRLRLENRFGRHRLGLTGTPPKEIASPVDVRADVSTASLRDWTRAKGELYVRLDYADVAAWREWLPMPVPIETGKGALRTWFEFGNGAVDSMVADVELEDVRAKLDADLPALDLTHLAGRLVWRQKPGEREIATHAVTFATRSGPALPPFDLRLAYRVDAAGEAQDGEARLDAIELEPLAAIAAHLPLPSPWRADVARYAPRGAVTEATYEWKGAADAPTSFRARAQVRGFAINAQGDTPGVSGLAGTLEATQAGGSIRVDSRGTTLVLPKVFAQPIALDTIVGDVSWERSTDRTSVRGTVAEFANADAAGALTFAWHSLPKGPGDIDLQAKVSRADGRRIGRYLPLQLPEELRSWLAGAVRQGTGTDGRVVVKGNLAEFPFASGKNGQFLVTAKVQGATLDYANGWPPISEVDGDLRFEGKRMLITATRGRALGAAIGSTTAEIADLAAPRLAIAGEASGPTSEFLAFVAQSPVAAWIDHATDGYQATGNGKLRLRFELGLPGLQSKVAGEYEFQDNELGVPRVPALSRLNGTLRFTERDVQAGDLTFDALGGSARASIASVDGRTRVSAYGTAGIGQVRSEYPSPWLDRATGTVDWRLAADARAEGASWVLESTLKGTGIDLPAPIGKAADTAVALRVERRLPGPGSDHDEIRIDYGKVARAVAQRRMRSGEFSTERALVLLGRAIDRGGEPDGPGIVVRGDVDAMNLDEWLALVHAQEKREGGQGGAPPDMTRADLQVRTLDVFGRAFHDVSLGATRAGGDWRLMLASREIEGTATWEPRGPRYANGRVSARLSRFSIPGPGEIAPWPGAPRSTETASEATTSAWPEIDLAADRYVGRRGELGRLELVAKPQGNDWRIEKLALVNDAGALTADGWWRPKGRDPQTRFDVVLDVKDAAAYLARFGMPDAVRGAPTKIEGQLSWNGGPDEFDLRRVGGSFTVNVGPGQFTKIEPGIGKLLGVLSLQALPRRITLDFRDVFSEGFAFDAVTGNVRVGNGVLHTENLQLNGPAANVRISGEVDLERETQSLIVKVQPSLTGGVSAGASAAAIWLLAANPIIGAAVGAGTLLAQKVMKDPIEQMFSYEYSVRGSWDEPVVQRMTRSHEAANADKDGAAPR